VHGKTVGYYSVGSASLGLTLGLAKHSEIIMFMTQDALEKFISTEGWSCSALLCKAAGSDKIMVRALLLRPGSGENRIVCQLDVEWKQLAGRRLSPPFPLVPSIGLAVAVDPTAKPVAVAIYIEEPFEAMRLRAVSHCYHLVLDMEPAAILENRRNLADNLSNVAASCSPLLRRVRGLAHFRLLFESALHQDTGPLKRAAKRPMRRIYGTPSGAPVNRRGVIAP
jgi:hypothetical protein